MSKKIIKPRYYKYPSLLERKNINDKIPQYERFNFKKIKVFESILSHKLSIEETNRLDNLFHWDMCLSNKFGKLKETHLFIITHSERGFNENPLSCNQREIVDRILFDYYVEIFYYYFFSTIENIAQILNIYFNLKIDEGDIYFNQSLFNKISNNQIKEQLELFYKTISDAKKIRNSFTHKFPINEKDYRTKLSKKNEKITLSGGSGEIISTGKILNDITDITNSLKNLTDKLKLELSIN